MASVIRGLNCGLCRKTHDFCLKDIFSSTAQYEYVCPETQQEGILIVPESTTVLEDECPDGSVEVTRRNELMD